MPTSVRSVSLQLPSTTREAVLHPPEITTRLEHLSSPKLSLHQTTGNKPKPLLSRPGLCQHRADPRGSRALPQPCRSPMLPEAKLTLQREHKLCPRPSGHPAHGAGHLLYRSPHRRQSGAGRYSGAGSKPNSSRLSAARVARDGRENAGRAAAEQGAKERRGKK